MVGMEGWSVQVIGRLSELAPGADKRGQVMKGGAGAQEQRQEAASGAGEVDNTAGGWGVLVGACLAE